MSADRVGITTVHTQAELDQALADNAETIYIKSPDRVWLDLPSSGTGSSHVVARDSSHVVAWGSSHVEARGSSHVVARSSSRVEAGDSSHVVARSSSHVVAGDSSHVVATASSHVVARDSSHVVAWGSSHVEASKYVAVNLHSQNVTLDAQGHVIDLTGIDFNDPAAWCEFHGVEVEDGIAYLYKAVDDDWKSGYGTSYEPGATPEAPDWNTHRQCGGGLHFCVRPSLALRFNADATRFLKCGVRLDEMVTMDDKVKAKRVVVPCVEVDRFGAVVEAVK